VLPVLWIVATLALADEPDALADWVRVEAVPRPAWLVGTVWLRDADGCVPAKVEDVARGRLAAHVCAEGDLTCDVLVSLDGGLSVTGERCRAGGARGQEVSAPTTASHVDQFPLIRADADVAAYQSARRLQVVVLSRVLVEAPCTPSSLRALTRSARAGGDVDAWLAERGVRDGHRTCDMTEGFAVEPILVGTSGPLGGVGTRSSSTPVDCVAPCPDNPVLSEIARVEAAIAGATFVRRDGAAIGVFRTEAACRAAPPGPDVLADDVCSRLASRLPNR
jgi:hypothetical protein